MATVKSLKLKGTKNDDILSGDAGADLLSGGDGHDNLQGLAGNDTLTGEAGNDTLSGGEGNDIIYGGSESNELWGDAGDDIIFTNSHDTIFGGAGNDTVVFTGDVSKFFKNDFVVDIANGQFYPPQNSYHSTFEVSNFTKNGVVSFKQGVFLLDIEAIRIDATMPFTFSAFNQEGINISINPKFKVNEKLPSAGTIYGTSSNDTITGGSQTDFLSGDSGSDILTGGRGKDFLYGGEHFGWDLSSMKEDSFSDTFKYMSIDDSTLKASDYIMDFDAVLDIIDLSAIDANVKVKGDQAFVFIGTDDFSKDATGQLRIDSTANYDEPNRPFFTLYGSINADSKPEFAIKLVSLTDISALLSASNFVL